MEFSATPAEVVQTRELVITNRLGLHARAAAQLVQVIQQFQADVDLIKNDEVVDASSVLSILALECPLGTKVTVRARGRDSDRVLEAVSVLFENKFGEE